MSKTSRSVFDVRTEDAAGRKRRRLPSFAPDLYWWIVTGPRDAARKQTKRDVHDFHEIICAAEGRGMVEIGRDRYDAQPGDVFLVNPGQKHRDYARGSSPFGVHYLAFACARRWRSVVARAIGCERFPTRIDAARPHLYELFAAIQPELGSRGAFHERVVAAHLDAFLFTALRSLAGDGRDAEAPRVAARVADLVRREPHERLSVGKMAEHCFLSRSYFSKVFKKETGESPARFVLRQRMHEARRLLAEEDRTISAIAHELGFEDEFYFSKVFKRMVGVSPSRFRSRSRS